MYCLWLAVLIIAIAGGFPASIPAQQTTPDTTARRLPTVDVVAKPASDPIGPLPDVRGAQVFAGKKTEVIRMDSITVNTAQNVSRQVIGRIPGANISETENSGFPSNGIGFRGLNPVQSVEMNVRENGVNIVADLYGYSETYYTPPADALARVELVRGSSSLQFGPQFGGVIDYVLRDGTPNSAPTFAFEQTAASFGTYTSYLSVGGGAGRLTYYAYGQYRGQQGWRPNSNLAQASGAARLGYRISPNVSLAVAYSMLRNRIHMPGGLDNDAFNETPDQSFRARNWLASPWNILSTTLDATLSPNTQLTSSVSYQFSQRYLVWRNEDGGPSALDTIDAATMAYTPREVEREYFDNVTNETRLRTDYSLLGTRQTLATGFRVFAGTLHRQEGGTGTTGSDFDMTLVDPYETDMEFGTVNAAVFAENVVHLGSRLSVTPGVRFEYLHSTARGHTDTTVSPLAHDRSFVLGGVGAEFHATGSTDLYANITQAYRPIDYSFLTPFASVARIDPHLEDPRGYNADLGWRGEVGSVLSFDVSAFYLAYNDRIGLVTGVDDHGATFVERTNVANSVHKGVEAYAEVRPLRLAGAPTMWGTVSLWDALGFTDARYTGGPFDGNRVEYAPRVVNRLGITYALGRLSTSAQWSSTSRQFTDADNTVASYDADVGVIPAYTVIDWSARWRLEPRTAVTLGVDNVAGASYFTMRTTEYPGPGIIPGLARSYYLGVSVVR